MTQTASLPPWALEHSGKQVPACALGDLFLAPAGRWPDKPAIHDGRTGFTFSELELRARALAEAFRERGVGSGDRVVVLAEKDAVMPVLAVAIWKCGATYVPLDSSQPEIRLHRLLERVQPRLTVSLDARAPNPPEQPWMTRPELDTAMKCRVSSWKSSVVHGPGDAAYIIFTSGSTGEPKGVEISSASLTGYFGNHNEVLRFTPESRVFSLSPFHFDVSIEDTLLPLSLGSFVYQFRNLHAGSIMRALIVRERITHLIAVSTLLTMITEDGRHVGPEKFPDLRMVMTGAELCDPGVINTWKSKLPHVRVINAYGPTEATIVCLTFEVETADPDRLTSYPIGRPLRNVLVRIVDRDGDDIQPESSEPGELWVGGPQIMNGYFGQPEATAQRLVEVAGVRFYRTGDMCKYDDNGDVVFVGRNDDEVKLAGRRIHLGEIRELALSCEGVDRAAVALIHRDGRKVIALVVVAARKDAVRDVERFMDNMLPVYMLPSVVGWSPTSTPSSTGKTNERELMKQLGHAVTKSNASRFAATSSESIEFVPSDGDCHV